MPSAPWMLILAQIPVPPVSVPLSGHLITSAGERGHRKVHRVPCRGGLWQIIFFPAVMPDTTLKFSWDLNVTACASIIYTLRGSFGARSSSNCCTCFLETQTSRNPGHLLGININITGNSLYYREISPCLVSTSFDFPCGWVFSQFINTPACQMEQKLIGSVKTFIPSPFSSILPLSSFLPWKLRPTVQLSWVTGSALTGMEAPQYSKFTVYLQVLQYCTV